MSEAIIGWGTRVVRGNVATADGWALVAEAYELNGPDESVNEVEVTHYQSPNGYIERIAGLKDGGEVQMTLNFVPSDASQDESTGIIADFQAGTVRYWGFVWPFDTPKHAYAKAFIKQKGHRTPVGDRVTMNVTLKIAGQVTWGDGDLT